MGGGDRRHRGTLWPVAEGLFFHASTRESPAPPGVDKTLPRGGEGGWSQPCITWGLASWGLPGRGPRTARPMRRPHGTQHCSATRAIFPSKAGDSRAVCKMRVVGGGRLWGLLMLGLSTVPAYLTTQPKESTSTVRGRSPYPQKAKRQRLAFPQQRAIPDERGFGGDRGGGRGA